MFDRNEYHTVCKKCGKIDCLGDCLDLCSSCPECGTVKTIRKLDDDLGEGYRVCAECNQEWYTNVKYLHHIRRLKESKS